MDNGRHDREGTPAKKPKPSCKYRDQWDSEFTFLKRSRFGDSHAFCMICNSDLSISHGGRNDISQHEKSAKHKRGLEARKHSQAMSAFVSTNATEADQIASAEMSELGQHMDTHRQACTDLEKATRCITQALQMNELGQPMDLNHKQACIDLEKATQCITQALQHEVGRNQELSMLIRRLEEKEAETGRSLIEQIESNKQLKLKIEELYKHLGEKDLSLTQANQTAVLLKRQLRDLHQQRQNQQNNRTVQDGNEWLQSGETQIRQIRMPSSPLQLDQLTAEGSLAWSEQLESSSDSQIPLVSGIKEENADHGYEECSQYERADPRTEQATSSAADVKSEQIQTSLVSPDGERLLEAPVSEDEEDDGDDEYGEYGHPVKRRKRKNSGREQTMNPSAEIKSEQNGRMVATMSSSSSTDNEENTPETFIKSRYKRCYMHINSVEQTEVNDFTSTRWNTYRIRLQQWLDLKGECRNVAENHKHCLYLDFQNIPEDAGFHHTCYRRFTDKNAIEKVGRRLAREIKQEGTEDRNGSDAIPSTPGSPYSGPMLPAECVICKKKEKLINKAGKRQRDPMSRAGTLTAGQLQKAAELKEDQSVLALIKDKDCVALEAHYHRGCYNQYTKFLRRPAKQNEAMFDVSYKIFCEIIVRRRLLVNKEVLRVPQLWKAFVELVKANEGLDASNYKQDTLKKRLIRDFPQLAFNFPTKRNVCELVFAETLSTDTLVDLLPSPSGAETTQSSGLSHTDRETSGAETTPSSGLSQTNREDLLPLSIKCEDEDHTV